MSCVGGGFTVSSVDFLLLKLKIIRLCKFCADSQLPFPIYLMLYWAKDNQHQAFLSWRSNLNKDADVPKWISSDLINSDHLTETTPGSLSITLSGWMIKPQLQSGGRKKELRSLRSLEVGFHWNLNFQSSSLITIISIWEPLPLFQSL